MRAEQFLHFTVAGMAGSVTTSVTQFIMTGDWSPVVAAAVGLFVGLLYLVVVQAIPRPQWPPLYTGKIVQWLKVYGQAMLILVLSTIISAIIVTNWTHDDRPTIVQETVEQSSVMQPVEEQPIVETPVEEQPIVETPVEEQPIVETPVEEQPIVETPVEEQPIVETPVEEQPIVETPTVEGHVLEDPNQELRTKPVCPIGAMPDIDNCDDLDRAVEKCGIIAVRNGELTHPERAKARNATMIFRGCLSSYKMSWEPCDKGEKSCYLFGYTGEKGFQSMRDYEGK